MFIQRTPENRAHRQWPTRLLLAGLIAVLGFAATGCEWMRWLRLLSLKKQLADVERHVRVEDKGDLTLHFLKPVVYADDLKLLIDGETRRTTNGNQVRWWWTYEKQFAGPGSETGDFGMSFAIGFENDKFNELRFPERFLVLLPKPLVVALLRSFGQAEVDLKRGDVKMKWVGAGKDDKVVLPTRAEITKVLGTPFMTTESNRVRTCLYKYYQNSPTPCSPAERLAWARFTFDTAGEQVSSSQGVIGNIGWSLTRVAGEAQPRVTFSLVPLSVEPVALKLSPESADQYVGQYEEPGGWLFNLGRDGDVYVASWKKKRSGGWSLVIPEQTNIFLGLPQGNPRYTFVRDAGGAVTGLVTQLDGSEKRFAKLESLPPPPAPVHVRPEVYAACAGRYKGSWGSVVVLRSEGEQLYWQDPRLSARVPLYPASETNFFFKAVDSPLAFERNEKGEVSKFFLHFAGGRVEAVKQKER